MTINTQGGLPYNTGMASESKQVHAQSWHYTHEKESFSQKAMQTSIQNKRANYRLPT